jgi:hypothetical protein
MSSLSAESSSRCRRCLWSTHHSSKGGAVGEREALEEASAEQGDCLLKAASPLLAADQARKGGDVDPVIAGRVELDCLAGDAKETRLCVVVANGGTELGERVAQVGARRTARPVGPEQAGQGVATVGLVRFYREIDEQCACPV